MKILINFIPIKKGGGQQVASNFINQVMKNNDMSLIFLTTENTYIHKLLIEKHAKFEIIKDDLFSRVKFQILKLPQIIIQHKIDVIYTMFGPGLHVSNILSITGCAYSNIFFPEINFWSGNSFFEKIKLKLIDHYRLKSTLRSDAIVFENEAMQNRAEKLFNFPKENTKLILPSISEYQIINDNGFDLVLEKINVNNFNIVLLSGWHKNKNIEILPYVLLELKKQGYRNISFVISVSAHHPNSKKLATKAEEFGVAENLVFLDSVAPHNIPILFQHIDGVGLFSLLESFSNNIIEAWYFNKPLFISNEEWSRSICKKAAVYVDRNNAKNIADKIIKYRCDSVYQESLAVEMKVILNNYPTPKEKVELQIEFIKNIYSEKNN